MAELPDTYQLELTRAMERRPF